MPGWIGWPELLVLILVLLLIFGPKRLPEMGRSMGKGLREFKDSVTGKDNDAPAEVPALTAVSAEEPEPAGFCSSCGNPLSDGARFCAKCGAPVSSAAEVAAGQAASAERDS
jgi:sec-independent protein translocase protein TatA